MKKILAFATILLSFCEVFAQNPGDTLVTATFNYSQTAFSRDTFVQFPDIPGITYEKIYMLYNMRCKNGLVSPGVAGQTNIGCGEWDYTCNTYIVDSTKVDSTKATHPSHLISGFAGTTYNYTTNPTYTYYQYSLSNTQTQSILSETQSTVGSPNTTLTSPFNTQHKTSKSQYLYTAAELLNAGLSVGIINSLKFNVLSAGSNAQFLQIKIYETTSSSLNASQPALTGGSIVYHNHTSFTPGINQLFFNTAFNWNGTSDLIVEFSFSNAGTGTNTIIDGVSTPSIMGLETQHDDYHFEFTGTNQVTLGNANFGGFSNQITIAFWSYGNPDFLPTNTSVAYATNAQNHRQVNIHFPWSNSNVYWDCGSGGPYDRINKLATAAEFEGQWNHWAFTKNTTTGIMNIYLNGALWHTGTGFTLPVQINSFLLGAAPNMSNPWYGKLDELSIWNAELSATDIAAWMRKTITASHPNYANLVAYYPFNEGVGNTATDISTASLQASTTTGNAWWNITKGIHRMKNFTEVSHRPVLTFINGNYVQTTSTTLVLDSVQNIPNMVRSFIVTNNNLIPFDTNYYYKSGYSYIYDANTNLIVDSIAVGSTGSIAITTLNYFQRSPSAFQIMSFVTPYGINLDLGMSGKTWTFDVTDYAPILKGWKRMFINGGGERQEDMDIKFVFIVGTPPRDVKDINNIWKVEAVGYTNILNDAKYEPRNVMLNPNSSAYKIKTAITGHGQEGEFIPRTHSINLNGGAPEFSWDVWKACGENPVYPQGGTWIYDRAGWCPGMATDVKEMEITSMVTPGTNVNIDYGLNTASGHSDYWISNQLVNYGSANFTLDASVIDVKNPSTKVEYARTNSICSHPIVVIRNTGSTTLTSLTIDYWVNNNTVKESFTWSGNLAFLETAEVKLPFSDNLWSAVNGPSNNIFHVELRNPNNGTDGYTLNNKFNSTFNITNVVPSNFIIWFKTNAAAAETSYEIMDQTGTQIFLRSGLANNTQYRDTFQLPFGCYQFKITDTDNDGIDFWANNDGLGFARFRAANGAALLNFEGDFGKSLIYNFTVDYPLSYEEIADQQELKLYPNPANDRFTIEGQNINQLNISVYNSIGQALQLERTKKDQKIEFDSSLLAPGLYHVVVKSTNGKTTAFKLIID